MSSVDEFGYHEAIDRLHVIANIADDHLLGHPAIAEAGQFAQIEEAVRLLHDIYQKVSSASDKKFHKE